MAKVENESLVERLRESFQEPDPVAYDAGAERGKEWARSRATGRELKRLEAFRNQWQSSWEKFFAAQDVAGSLARIITGDDECDSVELWEAAVGDGRSLNLEDGEFLRGFAEAALEIWDEVKEQV